MNIALIAEYLGTVKTPLGVPVDYAKANALALRCMAELPTDVWRDVREAAQTPTWEAALELITKLRAHAFPDDPLLPSLWVFHSPVPPPEAATKPSGRKVMN